MVGRRDGRVERIDAVGGHGNVDGDNGSEGVALS